MKSLNFEFLRDGWPDLAALGGFAEAYAHTDPQSALVKLRTFAERMVTGIYHRLALPSLPQSNLIDLLQGAAFREATPKVVEDKLHALRIHGNKAAHGEKVTQETALWLTREAYDLARWFYVAHLGGQASACPDYQLPPVGGGAADAKARLKQEKKAALQQLAQQEAQLQTLLAELEQARAKAFTAEQQLADLKAAASAGQQAADLLHFSESATRQRLIDSQLVDAGWAVGPNRINTEAVTQEEPVDHQPTETGRGAADYVLWDDNGKPLAVIEAKKTAVDAEKGRTQARLYADGLEKMHGQRPVIFYTNGFDIWIWDDANGYPPRKLFGFYSKDSLQYLVFQRQGRKPLDTLSPQSDIAGRLYQLEAIKRITERFAAKHRKALDRAGHRHRQDAGRHLPVRPAHPRRLGQAHPVPVRPAGVAQAGKERIQRLSERAPRDRRRPHRPGPPEADLSRHLPRHDEGLPDLRRRLLRSASSLTSHTARFTTSTATCSATSIASRWG